VLDPPAQCPPLDQSADLVSTHFFKHFKGVARRRPLLLARESIHREPIYAQVSIPLRARSRAVFPDCPPVRNSDAEHVGVNACPESVNWWLRRAPPVFWARLNRNA